MTRLKFINLYITFLVIMITFSGCKEKKVDELWYLNKQYAELSDINKISQLFFITVDPQKYYSNPEYKKNVISVFKKYKPGGVFFRVSVDNSNLDLEDKINSRRILDTVIDLNKETVMPLFVAADLPCGAWDFDNEAAHFPYPLGLASAKSNSLSYLQGKVTAAESKLMGINMLFTPYLNVFSKNFDASINSFGDDKLLTMSLGLNYIKGSQEIGIASGAKYYPADNYNNFQPSNYSDEMYKSFSDNIVSAIILTPTSKYSVKNNIVFSSAKNIKQKIGFNGILIQPIELNSDSLKNETDDLILDGLKSGIDMFILPETQDVNIIEIEKLVDSFYKNKINTKEIENSLSRIYTLKKWLKLKEPESFSNLVKLGIGLPEFHNIAKDISDSSVIQLKNIHNVLPVDPNDRNTCMIIFGNQKLPMYSSFFKDNYDKYVSNTNSFEILATPDNRIREEIMKRVSESSKIVCVFFSEIENENFSDIAKNICNKNKNVIIVSFRDPFISEEFPNASGCIVCISKSVASFTSVLDVLYGKRKATGSIPIAL